MDSSIVISAAPGANFIYTGIEPGMQVNKLRLVTSIVKQGYLVYILPSDNGEKYSFN